MRRLGLLLAATLWWQPLLTGCSDDTPNGVFGDGGALGVGGSVSDGGHGHGGGAGGGSGGVGPDPATEPVLVGVTVSATGTDGNPPSAADQLLAELTAFAAGVRVMSVDVRWNDIDPTSVSALQDKVAGYLGRGLQVVVNVLVVDGVASHQPTGLGGWDDSASVDALQQSLDLVVDQLDGQLHAVVLGRRVDSYIDAHPSEGAGLGNLLASGVDQLAASGVLRGVGLSYAGVQSSSAHRALLRHGDVVALAYLPGLSQTTIPTDTSAANDLDAMIGLAGGRPIHLQQVGYASSPALGSSASLQQAQLDSFVSALDSRRHAFPLVVVHQLHDIDQLSCEALLDDLGLLADDPFGAYMCSTGLRDSDDGAKEAWTRFLQATAHYAHP